MKINILRSASILTVLLMASGIFSLASAQPGNRFRGGERPTMAEQMDKLKLTEVQQKQMDELKAKLQVEALNINNLIKEKQAHIKTLLDMENRDANDLDKTIDVLSNLKGELMKKGIAHRDAVKKILTPEQMKMWDVKAKQRMQGMRHGMQRMGTLRGAEGKEVEVNGEEVEVEGKEVEAEGNHVNVERKVIMVEGKPMKVINVNIKEKKNEKTKKKSDKNEKEDEKEDR